MKKDTKYYLDIRIDKLTNSILNTISGDSFPTDVHPVTKADLKNVTRKTGWLFSWATELKFTDRQVFKLTIRDNPNIIQGLASISDYNDHYYLHLVESAPFNLGKNKIMKVFLEICLPLPARQLGTKVIRVSFHLPQRQNSLNITKQV